jgi:periplasmic divalent cation tolerance protein
MAATGSGGAVLAYITCASEAEAERIGRALVGERLAACINILPGMRSLYWWQGELTASTEAVLIAKTTAQCLPGLTARVLELHSYSCPCVVMVPLIGGNPGYLAWLAGEVRPGPPPAPAPAPAPGLSALEARRAPPTGAPPPG